MLTVITILLAFLFGCIIGAGLMRAHYLEEVSEARKSVTWHEGQLENRDGLIEELETRLADYTMLESVFGAPTAREAFRRAWANRRELTQGPRTE